MTKKADRRRAKRRRLQQADQAEEGRARRQAVEKTVEHVRHMFAGLSEAAEDLAVSPDAFATQVADLVDDPVMAMLLAQAHPMVEEAELLAEAAGEPRARPLAAAVAGRAASDARLVWLAAGLAEGSGDDELAQQVLEGALADEADPPRAAELAVQLARVLRQRNRAGDAVELLDAHCIRAPDNEALQAMRAWTLLMYVEEDGTVTGLEAGQASKVEASVGHFADRSGFRELAAAVAELVASDGELGRWFESEVERFVGEAREQAGLGPFDQLGGNQLKVADLLASQPDGSTDAFRELAGERMWLSGPDLDTEDELPDESTLLGRLAAGPATPARVADVARSWLGGVRYGLWQLPESVTGIGVWLTELVTRRRVFAAIPAEQLEGLPRWSVVAGALGPIDGVWRSGRTLLVLDPAMAERATDAILEMTEHVIYALARERGLKAPRPKHRDRSASRPHTVLAETLPPMGESEADLTSKVLGSSFPLLVGLIESADREGPRLTNTDGDPLEFLRATFSVEDPVAVRRKLLSDLDFEGEERASHDEIAGPVRWLGRVMSDAEAASSWAQFEAHVREQGLGPAEKPEGPHRYLRGTVAFDDGRLHVDVNSRRRLETITGKLRRVGVHTPPEVESQLDPTMDLALPGGRMRGGVAENAEVEAAWRSHWIDERVPALEGQTPRLAVTSTKGRVLLERLLRQFEFDADVAEQSGRRPLDVGWLRVELGMEDGVFGDDADDEDAEAIS